MTTTWNPSDKDASITLTNTNLTATGTSASVWRGVRGTTSHSGGQYYFKVQATAINFGVGDFIAGVANSSASLTTFVGGDAHGIGSQWNAGNAIYRNGGGVGNSVSMSAVGDYAVIAVDLTNNLYWSTVEHSGTLNTNWNNGSHSPAAGTGGLSITSLASGANVFPAFSAFDSSASATIDTTTTLSDSTLTGFSIWDTFPPTPFALYNWPLPLLPTQPDRWSAYELISSTLFGRDASLIGRSVTEVPRAPVQPDRGSAQSVPIILIPPFPPGAHSSELPRAPFQPDRSYVQGTSLMTVPVTTGALAGAFSLPDFVARGDVTNIAMLAP